MASDETGAADDSPMQGTFAMIKPDAVDRASLIFTRIVKEGFLVVEQQRFRFSRDLAELFYANHSNAAYFQDLIDYVTSGPVIGMVLARQDGLAVWQRVLGPSRPSEARRKSPHSIRAMFGDPHNDFRNACHGSDSPSSAEREIEIIFPHILQQEQNDGSQRPGTAESAMINGHSTVAIRDSKIFEGQAEIPEVEDGVVHAELARTMTNIVGHKNMDNKAYLQQFVVPTLLRGLSEMYEVRPQSPIEWLADWLEENNPNRD